MVCPECGGKMVAGKCTKCGYTAKGGKQAPPKKAPSKGKAPAKKGVPPQFLKKSGY